MAFCANCGAAVEGRYCAKCGSAVGGAAPAGSSPSAAVTATAPSGLSENAAATVCYALGLVTGIIFLVLEPYSKNKLIRFHALESIFMHVAVVVLWGALWLIFSWRMWFLMLFVQLGIFVLWVFMLAQTYQGKKVVLPVIGDLAAQQA